MASRSDRIEAIPAHALTRDQAALLGPYARFDLSRVMALNPELCRAFMVFGEQIFARSTLPPRDRQILILRTLALCGDEYATEHHRVISTGIGMTEAEIEAARAGEPDLPAEDQILVRAAGELVSDHLVSDATWAGLAQRYTAPQMIELVFLTGGYTMISMATKSFGVAYEE